MKSDERLKQSWELQCSQQRIAKERKLKNLKTQEDSLLKKIDSARHSLELLRSQIQILEDSEMETFESFRKRSQDQSQSQKEV